MQGLTRRRECEREEAPMTDATVLARPGQDHSRVPGKEPKVWSGACHGYRAHLTLAAA